MQTKESVMKTKPLANLALSAEQLSAMDSAYTTMQTSLVAMTALDPGDKRGGLSMGVRTEPFCRLALETMQKHPQLLPPRIPVADAVALLEAYDQLRPRVRNLIELLTRADDTLYSAGGSIYAVALEGYNALRRLGRVDGLSPVIEELGVRFAKTGAKAKGRRSGTPANPPDPGPNPTA
jgi:hypothetical protein